MGVGPTFPAGFFNHAEYILHHQENTSGYPRQFHYPESADHPTHVKRDNVHINLAPFSEIKQNSLKDPVIGPYHSMVYDVPFDKILDKKMNTNLVAWGLGLLALSSLLV